MPHFLLPRYIALLALLLTGTGLQTSAKQIEFSVLGIGDAFPQFAFADGSGWQTIKPEPFVKSPRHTASYQGQLALYPLAEGQSVPAEDATPVLVQFPPQTGQALILLMETQSGQFRAAAMNNAPAAFPPGKARLINLSTHPVAVRPRGAKAIQLQPTEQSIIEGNGKVLNLDIAFLNEGEWQMIGNRVLGLRPPNRFSIFVIGTGYNYFSEGTQPGATSALGPVAIVVVRE